MLRNWQCTITDFIFCYSTNQSFKQLNYRSYKKDLASAPSSFFPISVLSEDKFLVDCFDGGGLSSFFFFLFFFAFGFVVVEERFWGFNLLLIYSLYKEDGGGGGGSGGPPPENFGKSRMQKKPSGFFFFVFFSLKSKEMMTSLIWAGPWENVSYVVCEQQRRRSASASAQSDQRLCFHCLDSIISLDSIAEISRL